MIDIDVYEQIFAVVDEIPEGKVASYGQIAKLIGRDRNARLVGRALKHVSSFGEYPCHRVVASSGRLVPGWEEQFSLLSEEGIGFKANGHVNMRLFQWQV